MMATSQSIGEMYNVITTKSEEQEELIEVGSGNMLSYQSCSMYY